MRYWRLPYCTTWAMARSADVFERITTTIQTGAPVKHESWSRRILSEDSEIHGILTAVDRELPAQVEQIISGTFEPHYVTAAISSQLDVDRFDYLLRDSLMTGSRYGMFDLEWMLRTLAVKDVSKSLTSQQGRSLTTIVVDGRRGISGLELYALGRHYMYQNVYFHKTIRSAEMMLGAILLRAATLVRGGDNQIGTESFRRLVREETISVEDYLRLDDITIQAWIEGWASSARDDVLKDLSLGHRTPAVQGI